MESSVLEPLEAEISDTVTAPPEPPKQSLLDILATDKGYAAVLANLKEKGLCAPHPVMAIPSREWCINWVNRYGENSIPNWFLKRAKAIENEKAAPLYYGFEPPQWKDADRLIENCKDVLIAGSNRSSKSEYAAKRCVQMALKKDGAKIWCFSTSHKVSVRDQQQLIYKYLPPTMKKDKRWGGSRSLYSQAKGFSDSVIVFANKSELHFMNYEQDMGVIEGGQIDLWWADEAIPLDWIVTLRGRTVDRKGKGMVTYTPIEGFTPSISSYFTGSAVKQWIDADVYKNLRLWPGGERGKVPYILECLNSRHGVIFFQARNNPYISYDELLATWSDKPMQEALVRIHGITQKTTGNVFPRFGKHNIVSHETIEEQFKKVPTTRYQIIDFAWNRNWAMLWLGVQQIKDKKRVFVYREWPDYDTYGDWVIESDKPDGARGPAQAALGHGIVEYKRLIRDLEFTKSESTGGSYEQIYIRYGDPLSGGATAIAEEGATTIIDMLAGTEGNTEPLIVEPAAGRDGQNLIREGVNLINQWLEYNPEKPVIPLFNEPSLFVSSKCQNLISCMKMWTGTDGDKGASKDFIDALRYAAIMGVDARSEMPVFYGGGSY